MYPVSLSFTITNDLTFKAPCRLYCLLQPRETNTPIIKTENVELGIAHRESDYRILQHIS